MSELHALGVAALAVKVDVSARGELHPALEKVEETLGPISILVNNADKGAIAGVLGHAFGNAIRISLQPGLPRGIPFRPSSREQGHDRVWDMRHLVTSFTSRTFDTGSGMESLRNPRTRYRPEYLRGDLPRG